MQVQLAHLINIAESNAAESREIAATQRALVNLLRVEGRDTTVAREMLRVAEATQRMFETHLDQLKLLMPTPARPRPTRRGRVAQATDDPALGP